VTARDCVANESCALLFVSSTSGIVIEPNIGDEFDTSRELRISFIAAADIDAGFLKTKREESTVLMEPTAAFELDDATRYLTVKTVSDGAIPNLSVDNNFDGSND